MTFVIKITFLFQRWRLLKHDIGDTPQRTQSPAQANPTRASHKESLHHILGSGLEITQAYNHSHPLAAASDDAKVAG